MIEKMKFLNLTGPKAQIDRVVDTYLSKYEIHLENALSELRTVKDLRPFIETNPYRNEQLRAAELLGTISASQAAQSGTPHTGKQSSADGHSSTDKHSAAAKHSSTDKHSAAAKHSSTDNTGNRPLAMTLEQALDLIHEIDTTLSGLTEQKTACEKQLTDLKASRDQVFPFTGLNYDISRIMNFKSVKFRFGKISREYYEKFASFVYDAIDTILIKCQENAEYIWVVYFVPAPVADKIDAVYASMHFERLILPDSYEGTPTEATRSLEEKIKTVTDQIAALDQQIGKILETRKTELTDARERLERFASNFNVRKLAALTNHDDHTFFILCGWMSAAEAELLKKDLEQDKDLFMILEKEHDDVLSKPPTKMKNPKLFKPFELFIQMYGLPSYNEIDPTILIGLTYSFLFGFMFGDLGQGLCLLIGGFLLYRAKKANLAAIISCCGFFSSIFGVLFGSVFGFEDVIDALWLRPGQAMVNLPFIGTLNLVFIITVGIGMAIILLTMVLNVINSLREHDTEKTWFDTNGVAGLVFYGAMALTIVLFMSGKTLPASILLVVMFVLPLLLIFFKEPLTALVEKKSGKLEGGGMFFVQGFFELFEVLLSYFSNTLSFVRVGAFAVSHAAMMEVVLMLAGYETGNTNWVVIVFGNLFVVGMEGLIVGIQVLRLEYYELFSRFYRGTGRAFKPYGKSEEK